MANQLAKPHEKACAGCGQAIDQKIIRMDLEGRLWHDECFPVRQKNQAKYVAISY